jgi:photosystem II stability/assembly factor-like uncharacterized protein
MVNIKAGTFFIAALIFMAGCRNAPTAPAINTSAKWIALNLQNSFGVQALAAGNGFLYVGTEGNGIFYSADNGLSFSHVDSGSMLDNFGALAVGPDGDLFVATQTQLFRSGDHGKTFVNVSAGLGSLGNYISFAFIGSNVFLATSNGIFLSRNNGGSWSLVRTDVKDVAARWTPLYSGPLAVVGGHLFAGSPNGVLRSTDLGTSWSPANFGMPHTNANLLASSSAGLLVMADSDVFFTGDEGADWQRADHGLLLEDVFVFASTGPTLFATAGTNLIFYSVNNGVDWTELSARLPYVHVFALAANANSLFAGTGEGEVYWRPLY